MPIVFALTDEQGEQVMQMMAERGSSVRRACDTVGIGMTSFLRWSKETPERKEHYTRARKAQVAYWADELIDIADDNTRDVYTTRDGNEIVNYDHLARAKIRIDTRKFLLSKLDRDTYGEKSDLNVSGDIRVIVRRFTEIEGEAEEVKVIE